MSMDFRYGATVLSLRTKRGKAKIRVTATAMQPAPHSETVNTGHK
eukprot:COSAG02_NODE_6087_length_3812_cov_3.269324_3_plen_45_part_00